MIELLIIKPSSLGDIVLTGKWVWRLDRVRHWGLAALLPLTLPTGNPNAYAGRPGPTATPTIATVTYVERRPSTAYAMWPPSSWPAGCSVRRTRSTPTTT